MAAPVFWQRSVEWWDWQNLQAFLAESVPENQRLEYKRPSINKQSGRWQIDAELVETLVGFANTDDGILLLGVSERGDKRPGAILGIPHHDPETALRNHCAAIIEPVMRIETQTIFVPDGERDSGKTVLVVRVRRGVNPPYLVREHGVFLRSGDQDRHATVRDLQALFERRAQFAGASVQPPQEMRQRVFGYLDALDPELPPLLAVGLTPVFPVEPAEMNSGTDAFFGHILSQALGVPPEHAFLEEQGASYSADPTLASPDRAKMACAFSDGSVGLRIPLPLAIDQDGEWRKISVGHLWQELRQCLIIAADWSRGACNVTGPLLYTIGLGNIADTVLTLGAQERLHAHAIAVLLQPPQQRNRMRSWRTTGEWDLEQDVNDVIERELGGLARVLQARFYPALRDQIRQWSGG